MNGRAIVSGCRWSVPFSDGTFLFWECGQVVLPRYWVDDTASRIQPISRNVSIKDFRLSSNVLRTISIRRKIHV